MPSVFYDLMKKARKACKAKFNGFNSPHEGLAVIREEYKELEREVFRRKRKDDPMRFLNELVDIAAYCELFAEELMAGWPMSKKVPHEPKRGKGN